MTLLIMGVIGFLSLVAILTFFYKLHALDDSKPCTEGGATHKFESRYSEEGTPGFERMDSVFQSFTIASGAPLPVYKKTYIHDVCVRCGKTIKVGA